MAPIQITKESVLADAEGSDAGTRGTNGWHLKNQYRKWLRDTPEGRDEAEAIQRRLAALKETWERKGI